MGSSWGDVDDGFALAAVLGAHVRGALRVEAVTSVHGQTAADEAAQNTRDLLAAMNIDDVPVVEGADREGRVDAESVIPAGVRNVLALGPLSNVSAHLRTLEESGGGGGALACVVVGGLLQASRIPFLGPSDFNLTHDPAAAQHVINSPATRVTLVPLDVARHFLVPQKWVKALVQRAGAAPLPRFLDAQSERAYWSGMLFKGQTSMAMVDVVAAMHVVRPGCAGRVETRTCEVREDASVAWDTPNGRPVDVLVELGDAKELWGAYADHVCAVAEHMAEARAEAAAQAGDE